MHSRYCTAYIHRIHHGGRLGKASAREHESDLAFMFSYRGPPESSANMNLMHCFTIKVYVTWKLFSAYFKGLSKYRRMAFFFSKYFFFRFRDFCIMQIRSVMVSYDLQLKTKYWINNISWNTEAVFLKSGTTDVHHKRNKMTPLVLLP